MSEAPWLLLVAPDGLVLLAASGAPPEWTGGQLATLIELPEHVRVAGQELLARPRHAPPSGGAASRSALFDLPEGRSVQLVVLEAVMVRRVPTDLAVLLGGAMETLEAQARSLDVALTIEASVRVPKNASLDPQKVAWAIMTLAGNSMRYVRRGTRRLPGGSIAVKLDFVPEIGELVIRVEDDGPGIPAAKLPWLFTRAHDTAHAAGLGLMLVHEVVTAHGGTVHVESSTSAADHGTTVTLRLPVR